MNRFIIASALAIAAAAANPAFSGQLAGDIGIDQPTVSTASRAQVQSELQQARQSGVDPWAQNYDQLAGFQAAKSRAEVQAEFLRSRGEVAALTGEDSGSAYLATRGRAADASTQLAGQPVNAQ